MNEMNELNALVKKFYEITANRKAITACYESLRDRIADHMTNNNTKSVDINGFNVKLRVTETVNYDKAVEYLKANHPEYIKYRVDNNLVNIKTSQRVKDHIDVKGVTSLTFE